MTDRTASVSEANMKNEGRWWWREKARVSVNLSNKQMDF